jgi:hypothetical protein
VWKRERQHERSEFGPIMCLCLTVKNVGRIVGGRGGGGWDLTKSQWIPAGEPVKLIVTISTELSPVFFPTIKYKYLYKNCDTVTSIGAVILYRERKMDS